MGSKAHDLLIPNVTKNDIEQLEILIKEKLFLLREVPEILCKIIDLWYAKNMNIGTCNLGAHCAKKICPKCGGRGWVIDENSEIEEIEKAKEIIFKNQTENDDKEGEYE